MPQESLIKNIKDYPGQTVSLSGWLHNIRSSGKISFLQLRDGTGYIQGVVVKNQVDDKSWEIVNNLTLESAIKLTGSVKKDDRAPTGFELEVQKVELIHQAPDDYPIGKKSHGVGFLLDHRHLWLRTPKQQAILKIRNTIIQSLNQLYQDNDFTEIDTPIFTPVACEGTTTLFEVDYFGESAYLSQSGQLYLEAALPAFRRVYDFQPVFRAEKSKTRRHLIEFWMTNAEAAFVDHEANLKIQEQIITHIVNTVLENHQAELKTLERDTKPLEKITPPYPRISHKEAVEWLQKEGSQIKPEEDLGAPDEELISQNYDKPVFIEHYPAKVKAFYMKRLESDSTRAVCADLIAPEGYGEVIGGSERETDYDTLLQSMKKQDLPIEEYQWYLDQRKYGSVPHSGFGIGIERLVTWICGLKHVRTSIPYPRLLNRLSP